MRNTPVVRSALRRSPVAVFYSHAFCSRKEEKRGYSLSRKGAGSSFRLLLWSGLVPPLEVFSGRSESSFPEQRLVIEPRRGVTEVLKAACVEQIKLIIVLFQESSKPSEASKTEYMAACNKLKNKVQGTVQILTGFSCPYNLGCSRLRDSRVRIIELRKRKHGNKSGGNWGESSFPPPPPFPRSRDNNFACISLTCHLYYLSVCNRVL